MSTEVVAPVHGDDSVAVAVAIEVPEAPVVSPQAQDEIECAKPQQTTFLHSPPDSNNAVKTDASDSELSELDEEPAPGDAPQPAPTPEDTKEEEDDIGEVLPDHWSGSVPIFKPEMRQFKDFKRFVRHSDPAAR